MFSLAAYEYHQNKVHMKVSRMILRDTLDPFDMPDERFREMYRLPRCLALDFLKLLDSHMDHNVCPDVPLTIQFGSVLNFYASGSYQRRVGSDAYAMISQTLVSRCVRYFSWVITTKVMDQFIQFPRSVDEIRHLQNKMQFHTDFPGAFGMVDGSLIGLAALSHEIEHSFVSRKSFHAINAQFVVDVGMRFLSVNARYPGSTHDSLIWRASLVNSTLRDLCNREGEDWKYFLLADHGYPLMPWVMKPYDTPTSAAKAEYNRIHRKLRSLVERAIGLLKARFRCLLNERKLRYDPLISGCIIYSCSVLHNYLIDKNFPVNDLEPIYDIANFDEDLDDFEISLDELERGKVIRDNVADYFINN
ncbi:hypothetical protein HA402_014424 [Bradysia odoriphaga]|nr:hypothetical protein HA402_014424 [Bradysia odoriphaga]